MRDRGVNARLAKCLNSVLNLKAVVTAFNQEKALVGALGAFSVITNLRMELFEALVVMGEWSEGMAEPAEVVWSGDLFILLTSHCPATVATV